MNFKFVENYEDFWRKDLLILDSEPESPEELHCGCMELIVVVVVLQELNWSKLGYWELTKLRLCMYSLSESSWE